MRSRIASPRGSDLACQIALGLGLAARIDVLWPMAISDDERFKLRYGPYKTPRFKYGKRVQDEWRGEVTIVGLSSGRIPWPMGKAGANKSLVVY
jgi:hypothetical protein